MNPNKDAGLKNYGYRKDSKAKEFPLQCNRGGIRFMTGYKQPCRYCGGLLSSGSRTCPLCGKVNPLGSQRCPKCRNPIKREWIACSNCGLSLKIDCPQCRKDTFFGDYCDECEARILIVCPNRKCKAEQPPISDKCVQCGKPIK